MSGFQKIIDKLKDPDEKLSSIEKDQCIMNLIEEVYALHEAQEQLENNLVYLKNKIEPPTDSRVSEGGIIMTPN